jgi:hypothetical protein
VKKYRILEITIVVLFIAVAYTIYTRIRDNNLLEQSAPSTSVRTAP